MRFAAAVILRTGVTLFCLLTAAYGVLNCSPFAFEMFVRPQLFPWLSQFVAWHHLWLAGAYVASLVTLTKDLDWRIPRAGRQAAAHRLALAFAVVFGILTLSQQISPFVPTLWNDHRALPTTLVALLPLLWLAAVDHLSVERKVLDEENCAWTPLGQERLLLTCAGVAGYLWLTHLIRALTRGDLAEGSGVWVVTGVWTLTLTMVTFALIYSIGCVITKAAVLSRAPRTTERVLITIVAAAGVGECLRRFALPTLSLSQFDSWVVSIVAGAAVTTSWSGVARRLNRNAPTYSANQLGRYGTLSVAAMLITLPVLCFVVLNYVERVDWAFVGQRFILVSVWASIFAIALHGTRGFAERRFSALRMLVPPLAAVSALFVVPKATTALAAWTGDSRFEPTAAFDRYAASDAAFQLMSNLLVSRQGFNVEYYRALQESSGFSGPVAITVPTVDFSPPRVRSAVDKPDIFVFAVDSVRRDYLSPYNPLVRFTPSIGAFASESFVFRNAFTRHGGTELAIPSIWAGAIVVRQARTKGFERINAFEKFVNAEGYRVLINDYTIAQNILPTTPLTRLNPGVPSVETDLCRNLDDVRSNLNTARTDRQPVLGFFAPMNVHILNTQRGGQGSLDGDYPGFYAPYASRLRRLDACFGEFISYLKQTNRYDRSIIVFTTDHGDSLGENGYWGHSTWLTPEVVRIPLIIKLPRAAERSMSTDLDRIAFSTDIAPTLYALLGREVRDLGPVLGSPLFVPAGSKLTDRTGGSFLVTASYGATYGLLRRNGRELFVTDLVERRELAYDLSRGAVGASAPVTQEIRQVNQREIQEQVAEIARFYRVTRRQTPSQANH